MNWEWLYDTSRHEPTTEYVVDITKPPVFPPRREFRTTFLGGYQETNLSRRRKDAWIKYIKEYGAKCKERGTHGQQR